MIVHDFPIGNPFDQGFDGSIFGEICKFLDDQFEDYYDVATVQNVLFRSEFFAPLLILNQRNGKTHFAFSTSASFNPSSAIFILYRSELSLQENLHNMVIRYVRYEDA